MGFHRKQEIETDKQEEQRSRFSDGPSFRVEHEEPQRSATIPGAALPWIDTAILLCGVLTCRQYFADTTIQNLATQIYSNVNFAWMLGDNSGGTQPTLRMGWTPENGFLAARWDRYSELMMLYLLAMAAPNLTFAIPASSWAAWTRPSITYQGLS